MVGDSGLPQFETLIADVRLVREKGLSKLRGVAVPALHQACRVCQLTKSEDQDPVAIEALIASAVETIGGGRFGEAAQYTFGLIQGTRMWSATERRVRAARAQGVSKERFRKGYEPSIIDAVAEGILVLMRKQARDTTAVTPLVIPDRGRSKGADVGGLTRSDLDLVAIRTLDTADEFTLGRLLPNARSVDIYSRAPVNILNRYAMNLSRVVQAGGSLRVIFFDADVNLGLFIYPLAEDGKAVLRRNIDLVKDRLGYVEGLVREASGVAEFRTSTALQQYGMTVVHGERPEDSKMVVQLSLPFTRTETDRPLLCLTPSSPWFQVFEQEFSETWRLARPYVRAGEF